MKSLQAFAHYEHLSDWDNKLVILSVHHKEIGWIEFEERLDLLPPDFSQGDELSVTLIIDDDEVISHTINIPVSITKSVPKNKEEISGLPTLPEDWGNKVEVDRYFKESEEYEEKYGFARKTLFAPRE